MMREVIASTSDGTARSCATSRPGRKAASSRPAGGSAMIAPVRIGVALPNYGPLARAETLVRLACLAEDLGVDGVWVSDHLVAPVGAGSISPYDRRPDAKPADLGALEEFYEPLTTLAFLAGRTS